MSGHRVRRIFVTTNFEYDALQMACREILNRDEELGTGRGGGHRHRRGGTAGVGGGAAGAGASRGLAGAVNDWLHEAAGPWNAKRHAATVGRLICCP